MKSPNSNGRTYIGQITDAFASCVRIASDKPAIVTHGRSISYAELDVMSDKLAVGLRSRGIGLGDFIAVVVDRSPETVIAWLAVLKAGAAYLPIDRTYPNDSISFMLSDCEPKAVLVGSKTDQRNLPENVPVLSIADLHHDGPTDDTEPCVPQVAVSPEDPANIIYTSGSTGRPKGVVVSHGAVANLVLDQNYMDFDPSNVYLLASALTFDACTWEVWGALLTGATLAVVEQPTLSVADISCAIAELGVDTMFLTPALFHVIVDVDAKALTGLRQLLVGGDVASPDHVRRFLAEVPETKFINIYGPTETTTYCMGATIDNDAFDEGKATLPIGTPIGRTKAYILDDHRQPLPDGEDGMLWISGDGVAIGYHNRPELTAEVFREDPFTPGNRMYNTGDVACRSNDGIFTFKGRRDRQVKIAGKRIELAEVEFHLRRLAGVKDAMAVAERLASGRQILVGFAAVGKEELLTSLGLLQELRATAPAYLVPSELICVESFPLTANGKVDRAQLISKRKTASQHAPSNGSERRTLVRQVWTEVLGHDRFDDQQNFFDCGGTSLSVIEVQARLEKQLGESIPITKLFAHPTVSALSSALSINDAGADKDDERNLDRISGTALPANAVAIVGMSGRFPGADDVRSFWDNVCAGRDSISHFDPAEIEDAFSAKERSDPDYVAARSVLEHIEDFDAGFFNINARDAALIDPQQRIFLESCWHALEDAGYAGTKANKNIGVFAGASMNSYFLRNVMSERKRVDAFTSNYQVGQYSELLGALPDFLSTRVSYKLGLTGPSMNVQSACSTSLLAVTLACQSVVQGQCKMALAGGVSVTLPQRRGYFHTEGGMVSPDGRCRPYDAEAGGTVFGHGAGVVLLKRADDAIADGDHIYAIIIGYGTNNDGAEKIGFTAPSVGAQTRAIDAAYAMADVEPDTIGFIEGHGTATPLGDPIEFEALSAVVDRDPNEKQEIYLGSVKGNVGHLDAAAGVTGLISAASALKSASIPPLAHFQSANPRLSQSESRLRFNRKLRSWPVGRTPRRAAVNSLGVGGTNVHIVLQEAPVRDEKRSHPQVQSLPSILPVSAKEPAAAAALAKTIATYIDQDDISLADVATTLQQGRMTFDCRAAISVRTKEDAVAKLQAIGNGDISIEQTAGTSPPLVYMFPGQGAQFPGMGADLVSAFPEYKKCVEQGVELLKSIGGANLESWLLADDASAGSVERLQETAVAQPALYITEYAMAQQLMSWGAKPTYLVGHSVGEFAAAAVAGVFSFEDGLRLICARARAMANCAPGAMLSVRLSVADLEKRLPADLDIAAVNAMDLAVVAGAPSAIDAFANDLTTDDIVHVKLPTSHAFHSRLMDGAIEELKRAVSEIELQRPQIAIRSTVTGDWLSDEEARSSSYWARHCRLPVRFADAAAALIDEVGANRFIEVGPGNTLVTLARRAVASSGVDRKSVKTWATLQDEQSATSALESFGDTLAQFWMQGFPIDWDRVNQNPGRRVPLPTYPFQRRRHFIDAPDTIDLSDAVLDQTTDGNTKPFAKQERLETIQQEKPVNRSSMSSPEDDLLNRITADLCAVLCDLSGEAIDLDATDATFLELGFDSLMLGQVTQRINRSYKTKIKFRELLSQLPTVSALSEHLADQGDCSHLGPSLAITTDETVVAPSKDVVDATNSLSALTPPNSTSAAVTPSVGTPGLQGLVREQLASMERVFAMQIASATTGEVAARQPVNVGLDSTPSDTSASREAPTIARDLPTSSDVSPRLQLRSRGTDEGEATPAQREFIVDLAARLQDKMPGSKSYTARYRNVLADPRAAAGFKAVWKELVYPVVSSRAAGAHIWDVDGNKYVDVVCGFGQTAFGHSPSFVTDALQKQLAEGFPIGPQSHLAGDVAERICRMTGNERATFCNTGSEAIMAAIRVARAVTGREKVVLFGGGYHGQFDEVLVRQGRSQALPIAPGIPTENLGNIVVLPYGEEPSLEWVQDNAEDLACVIVEPVQSRRPSLQPLAFLKELRETTTRSGTALVFDEVVTGFRAHLGGMQAVYDIRADMATYGKVLGGGMPIGVLAGSAQFLDALDGGPWQFGDESSPDVSPTFFAGTFVRHPLALVAANAVLSHLETEGLPLLENLNNRTVGLAKRLNALLDSKGTGLRIDQYASWMFVNPAQSAPLASLLFPTMRLHGIHAQEGFPWFMTTAHSDADFDAIVDALDRSVDALQSVDILEGRRGEHALSPQPPADMAPSEPMREVYLAAQLSDAASCAFNEGVTLTLAGELDRSALQTALDKVIARHPILRASFGATGESIEIAESSVCPLDVVDFSSLAEVDQAVDDVRQQDQSTPFDLESGPLLRAKLLRCAVDRHQLILCGHHSIIDGSSFGVLITELAELYNAAREGREARLEPAAGLSSAMRRIAPDNSREETYWLEQFREPPPSLELPTDHKRPEVKRFEGATYEHSFGSALMSDIRKLGAVAKVTPHVVLFTAVQGLLNALTKQTDLTIAVPMAGQQLEDEDSVVGHLVNFLPVRADVQLERSLREQLTLVRNKLFSAYENQDCTLGRIVSKLNLPRRWDRTPLTDVQFNFESEIKDLNLHGLTAKVRSNPKTHVNFDLFFNFVDTEEGLRLELDYTTDLFEQETVRNWIVRLEEILTALTARDALEAKMTNVVGTAPESSQSYQLPAALSAILAAATERPGEVAIVCSDTSWTYDELVTRVENCATQLRSKGLQPGDRVAVAADRSPELIALLLGAWRAGLTFIPMDPTHPPERLKQQVDLASAAALIVTDLGIGDSIAASCQQFAASDLMATPDQAVTPGETIAAPLSIDEPAYVIFTSGSTGVPKGVEVGHDALANFLSSMAQRPGIVESDTLLAVTTACFDIALLELLLPLTVGAKVVVAEREEVVDGFALAERLTECGATMMQATPSLWVMMLEADFVAPKGFKILSGGEPLARDLAARLLEKTASVWNMYGPTETTIWSSVAQVRPEEAIHIGEPIANTEFTIVDDEDRLVSDGVQGNLLISGGGLANGYLNRPDLTAQAFVELAIDGGVRQRYYRTGDIAMRSTDGKIVLSGRRDQQIKFRGFRIELEEIETAIRAVAEISEVAVGVVRSELNDERLAANFVSRADAEIDTRLLTDELKKRLPRYMVPSVWQQRAKLPRTPNGKLDRKSLFLDVEVRAGTPVNQVEVTPNKNGDEHGENIEQQLIEIWSEVLEVDQPNTQTPLFDFGADSLSIFRIVARARKGGVRVTAHQLFKNPTITKLAEECGLETDAGSTSHRPDLGDYRRGRKRAKG